MTAHNSSRDVWVGVDLGTQSVRAVAVTSDGDVAGSGTYRLTSHRDGVRHEQDPRQWWEAVCAALRAALLDVAAEAVRGISVDGTSGTILLVDADGDPLTPALMYDDTRAAAEVARVNAAGEQVWRELGYQRMQPAWALPKLLWLIGAHPDVLEGARLAHQTDFVNRRLVGGDVATDLSTALKTGAHLVDEAWPGDVLDELGVPARLLPSLVRPGVPLGTVCAAAADLTGLRAATPVVSGATDGFAAQLGAGAMQTGGWNSVLGTTLVLKGVSADLVRDPLGAVYCHKAPDGSWLPGGASSTGAGVVARDFADRDLEELNRQAQKYEPAETLTYPLVSKGERFPFVAPDAEGFVLGSAVDEAERYASVLQGVGYIERLCFDYLDFLGAPVDGKLVLTGGATKNDYWCQLRADILNRAVTLPQNSEPALGMAILAASPGRDTAEVAADMVRVRQVIEPRSALGGLFDDSYLRFVATLEQRGWLPPEPAEHARERTAR